MKTVYLVRHGQSIGNASSSWQPADSPLSELGLEQAAFLAKRCTALPIEKIISSSLPRASKTAEIISQQIKLAVEYSALFEERRRPTEQIGADRQEDAIDKEIIKNWDNPTWHYSNEENFEDVKSRALEALHFLEQVEAQQLLVVTHGLFLRILLGCVLFGKDFTSRESSKLINNIGPTANTGLTIFEHSATSAWRMRVWNDHAHLGD